MKSIYGIEYKNGLLLDLHLPEVGEFDLFVYFHGGFLRAGSRSGVEVFAKTLSESGIAVASVDYRLYPNAKFPDYIVDSAESVRWLSDNIGKYGKCRRFIVGGSSAGAYISMMLCFNDEYYKNAGVDPSLAYAYIHDAGQPTSHSSVLSEFGIDSKRVIVDKTAPLYFVGEDESYPPMLFVVSDNDLVGRYEQTMLMVKTLEHFGNIDNVSLCVRHVGHCAYVKRADADGRGEFANIILPFISSLS